MPAKKTAFELELDRLGEKAKAFTPDPEQEPTLLLQKSRAFSLTLRCLLQDLLWF